MTVFYPFCTCRSSTKREKLEEAQDEQPAFSDLDEPLKECTLSSVNAIGKEVRKRHCIVIDLIILVVCLFLKIPLYWLL